MDDPNPAHHGHLPLHLVSLELSLSVCRIINIKFLTDLALIKLTLEGLSEQSSAVQSFITFRTISDPPGTMEIFLENGQKFAQCEYGWWDHSIALGQLISDLEVE